MRLFFNIVLIVGVAIIALTFGAWLWFVHTPPGRDFLKTRAQSAAQQVVRDQLASELQIGELENGLPSRIALNDVSLSADGEVWFQADRLVMQWSPFALINRKVVIQSFTLEDGELLAMPPPRPEPEEEQPDEPFALPTDLPWIEIDSIRIDPLQLADGIAGPARSLRAEGSFSTADNRISSNLQVTTDDNRDLIRAIIGTRNRNLTVDLSATSEPDGLLNHYLDAGGPVRIALDGSGPLSEWAGTLSAEAAAWGNADLEFRGNLAERNAITLTGAVSPGANWPEDAAAALGDRAEIDIAMREGPSGRTLTVDRIDGAFGLLSGRLNNIDEDFTIDNGAIDLTLDLATPYARRLSAEPLAGENRLTGTLDYNEDGHIRADGTLTTPAGTVRFADLSYTGERFAAGLAIAMGAAPLDNETVQKLFPNGGEIRTDFVYENSQVSADNLVIFSGQNRDNASLRLTGNARYGLENRQIRADGTLRTTQSVIARFTDAISFSGPVSGQFNAAGTPDDLDVRVNADYAAGSVSDRAFAAGALSADFTGLPASPQGTLQLTSGDDSYGARVRLDTLASNDIVARELFIRTPTARLAGDARVNPETLAAEAQLLLETADGATLPDGRSVSGTAELDLTVTPTESGARAITADLTANDLVTDDASVKALSVSVRGTDREADVSIDLQEAVLPNEYLLAEFTSEATVSRTGEAISARIASLVAKTGTGTPGETIRLLAPTTVTYEAGAVQLAETRIDGFDRSEATLAGRYGAERWVLTANGSSFRVPGLQSPLNFEIDLDTDREVPGTITLSGEVQDQNDVLHRMVANGEWDGETLSTRAVLRNGDRDNPGELVFSMPLFLTRGETLGIQTGDGTIDGRFSYDAGIENILAFVPLNEDFIAGQLTAEIDIAGTLSAPEVTGDARLSDARFEEPRSGAVLTDMTGTLDFSYNAGGSEGRFEIIASDAAGRARSFNLTGAVQLGDVAGEAGSSLDGSLVLDRATVIDSPNLIVRTNADLELSGTVQEMLLAGTIDILNFDAVIPDLPSRKTYTPVTVVRVDGENEEVAEPEQTQAGSPVTVNLDIDVNADNQIYINGRGLESEWQTDLSVTGTAANPVLAGDIRTIDGTFDFAGRQFDITTGNIIFNEANGLDPRLDLAASYSANTAARGSVTAIIEVSGAASDPTIELASNPTLPQEDIMSLILFGKNPGQLSAYESLQIARSIATLTATGPFGGAGITNTLRRSAGLDTLSFGEDAETGGNTLTVGKYVSDDVYVSATQGLGDAGSSVSVTYEVSDKVTVETTVEQNGAQSVSANYKRDY